MIIGIDIDNTLTKYPEFFVELGLLIRNAGGKVYIITALGHRSAIAMLNEVADKAGHHDFYDDLIDTSRYNTWERSLIGKIKHNEILVGHFKQRICKELGVQVMFDDQSELHRYCGDTPIFGVPKMKGKPHE